MRLNPSRIAASAALALVLWSCSENDITGPSKMAGPGSSRLDVVAANGLMITEVMPDPRAVADGFGEWFELHNAGSDTINLQGYRIVSAAGATASESHTIISAVIVEPGDYVVLGNNANSATNGGVAVAYSYGTGIALNNGNNPSATEWLAIKSPTAVLLDSVAYVVRGPAPWAGYTPPSGASRAVFDLTADNTIISGTNWITSTTPFGAGDRGTPGQPNTGGAVANVTVRISWVTPGTTFRVTAQATDAAGIPTATNFTWASSNNSIATVDPATGVATGVSLGIVTLTATALNGVSGTAPLFVVSPGDVGSVSLSMNDPDQVPVGYTKPIFPTTRTTTSIVVTPRLVWSSSNEGVATVDSLGYVTGVATGAAIIRATAPNGVYGIQSVTIIPATAPTTAVYRNHVEFGSPIGSAGILLNKPQFVSSYNAVRGGPDWVAWNLNGTQFGAAPRCDCFSADQTLPAGTYRVVDFDYRNGGYDRGHMVQSESRTTTDQENASTFLMTNILPQAANNNQGPWSRLENELNDSVRTGRHEAYVIAGGLYAPTPTTLKNEGKVQIPDFTWKIVVIVGAGEGLPSVQSRDDLRIVAVLMPNLLTTADTIRNVPWQNFQVTVDSIETLTGYDFLTNLPNPLEEIVESNDRAPVATTNGPYTGSEGAAVTLDASSSTDPDNDVLTYAWTFGDGSIGTGATPVHTYADNGVYNVQVIVTDEHGAADTAATAVTISNVPPAVAPFTGATILPDETYSTSGSFTDPGADTWTATINYGDGSGVQPLALTGKTFSLSHTYANPGTFTVTVTVTDDDNGSHLRTASVTVLTINGAFNQLDIDVRGLASIIGGGETSALRATLRAALGSYDRENPATTVNQLQAFINQLQAKVNSGQLTAAQAAPFIAYAQRIIDSIT